MTNAIELCGTLILTVVGFVVPILTILISIFPEGTKILASRYENEKNQSKANIQNELVKREKIEALDINAFEKTLKTLKNKLKKAESKLGYLKPTQFLLRTAIPFVVSFIGILIALLIATSNPPIPLFFIKLLAITLFFSFLSFIWGLRVLFISISVLFEVSEIVSQQKNEKEDKIVTLISDLIDENKNHIYLKDEDIQAWFNGRTLKKDDQFDFAVDKQHEISVKIVNSGDKMAKKVEVGFCFPKDVVIENTPNLSITPTEEEQIVRFNRDEIQARESNIQGELKITFLKSGLFDIETFIKGENVKFKKFVFKLNIVS